MFLLLLLLVGVSGCGGRRQPPPAAPAASPAGAHGRGRPSDASAAPAPARRPIRRCLPPAPALDTLVPPEELAAELRLAADSAADEAVLEALDDARPADDDSRRGTPRHAGQLGHRRRDLQRPRPRPVLPRLLPGHGPRADGHLAHPHAALRRHDPRAAAGAGAARRPRLPGADRERLLQYGHQPGQGRRDVAVHEGHRQGLRAPGGLAGSTSAAIPTRPPPRPRVISRTSTTGSARSTSPRRRTTPARARCRAACAAARRRRPTRSTPTRLSSASTTPSSSAARPRTTCRS